MQKYQNNVISPTGQALANVSVLVNTYPQGIKANIFSDNGVTPATNPLTTDANGAFSFYADDGHYSLVISGPNVQTITLTDIVIADEIPSDNVAATTVHDTDIITVEQSGALRAATVALLRDQIFNTPTPLAILNGGTGATTADAARMNLSAAKSGANGDITSLTGLTTPLSVAQGGTGLTAPIPLAQCYLANDATTPANVTLSRLNGKYITINGSVLQIPAAGVSLIPSGLTAGTSYSIYAFDSGGATLALEASTTTQTIDANTGMAIKTGDPTRILVGRAFAADSNSFANSAATINVLSYFNRRLKTCAASTSGLASGTHAPAAFANIALENWSVETIQLSSNGIFHNDTPSTANFAVISNSVTGVAATLQNTFAAPNANFQFPLSPLTTLTGTGTRLNLVFNAWCNAGVITGDSLLLIGSTFG